MYQFSLFRTLISFSFDFPYARFSSRLTCRWYFVQFSILSYYFSVFVSFVCNIFIDWLLFIYTWVKIKIKQDEIFVVSVLLLSFIFSILSLSSFVRDGFCRSHIFAISIVWVMVLMTFCNAFYNWSIHSLWLDCIYSFCFLFCMTGVVSPVWWY